MFGFVFFQDETGARHGKNPVARERRKPQKSRGIIVSSGSAGLQVRKKECLPTYQYQKAHTGTRKHRGQIRAPGASLEVERVLGWWLPLTLRS